MSTVWTGPMGPRTDNRGHIYVVTYAVLCAIAGTVMVARLVARIKYRGKLFWDDYLMTISMLCAIALTVITTQLVRNGVGQHIYYIKPEQFAQIPYINYIAAPFYVFSGVFGRVSFAVSLLMIMGTTTLRKAVLWFVIVSQLITGSVVVGLYLFNCNPIKKSWLPKTPGKCFVPGRVKYPNMVYLGLSAGADAVLVVMPCLIISSLQIKRRVKIGLIVLLALGFATMAMAVAVVVVASGTAPRDFTYDTLHTNILGAMQLFFVIIIASIPFIRPLVPIFTETRVFSWLRSRSRSSRSGSKKSPSGPSETAAGSDVEPKRRKFPWSLPHIPQSKFATTTLRNAGPGMEQTRPGLTTNTSNFDSDGDTNLSEPNSLSMAEKGAASGPK